MSFRKITGFIFIAMGVLITILIRIKAFHNTEMEVLIYYWPYWLLQIITCIIGVGLIFYPEEKR